MKLKEYRKTNEWNKIDCAVYLDADGKEIDPTTSTKWRRMNNMEIASVEKSKDGRITTATITLKKAVRP